MNAQFYKLSQANVCQLKTLEFNVALSLDQEIESFN